MCESGARWVAGIDHYDALAITDQRRIVWTAGVDHLLIRYNTHGASGQDHAVAMVDDVSATLVKEPPS
jgi:hypothetical protein